MFDVEITIIGAGVVGLSVAAEISQNYNNVFVIDKNTTFGQETSSRNSEVIHAGIYYPKDSLKANLCVEGKQLIYKFCDKYDVPYNNCGKIIVANSEEEERLLEDLRKKAFNNGVDDIRFLNVEEINKLEPNISAIAALYSPSTGIIDSYALMKQLETNAVNNAVSFAYNAEVVNIKKMEKGYEVFINDSDGQEYSFKTKKIINSAGLESYRIFELLGIIDEELEITFCKGNYFRINPPKNKLINRLVYPVPNPNMEGIGIHVTIDMGGGVKLGPDVSWMAENIYDYKVDKSKQKDFYNSAKRFLPFLKFEDLSAEMAGIRPKLQVPGGPVRDFYIEEETDRGFPGFVNLIGIESPGLTSSLAIAKHVKEILR